MFSAFSPPTPAGFHSKYLCLNVQSILGWLFKCLSGTSFNKTVIRLPVSHMFSKLEYL